MNLLNWLCSQLPPIVIIIKPYLVQNFEILIALLVFYRLRAGAIRCGQIIFKHMIIKKQKIYYLNTIF